tara:strand:+ start:1874 stop:3853 length:1980 start_codon:yes stop_codon:yes gene_type:complete
MCGIFSFISNKRDNYDFKTFERDNLLLNHRGPDHNLVKEYTSNNYKIFLGHNRLSIQDLSQNGIQPMNSSNNRFTIIYNGEIYNHKYIRSIIDSKYKISWMSNCDTETILNFYQFFYNDIEFFFNTIEGQFAFLIYDKKLDNIIISRDQTGEKPLYLSTNNGQILISSDLKPIISNPNFNKEISHDALKKYLSLNYIPNPETIFKNTFKLPPASYLKIKLNDYKFDKSKNFNELINSNSISFHNWWSYKKLKNEKIISNKNVKKFSYYKDIIKNSLSVSVKKQTISDVEIGTFLSSGLDSSLITSMLSKHTSTNSFSIGFEYSNFDESKISKKIANYLNTNHNEFVFTAKDTIDIIPDISKAFSEPFADSSQLPTMLISKFASSRVKVIMSGDGGDELFGGYNRYILAEKFIKIKKILPFPLYQILIKTLNVLPKTYISNILNFLLDKKNINKYDSLNVEKFINKISSINNIHNFYFNLVNDYSSYQILLDNDLKMNNKLLSNENGNLGYIESLMRKDFETYMTDDILCKVDRSSMNYSLENRAPFLDKEVIKNSYLIPNKYKINNYRSKFILKEILKEYLPDDLISNEKKGFAVPISIWIKNELKDWAHDMVIKDDHSLFNKEIINKLFDNHINDKENNEHKLWAIIQFNQWYEEYVK